jgi:hypothetical protein
MPCFIAFFVHKWGGGSWNLTRIYQGGAVKNNTTHRGREGSKIVQKFNTYFLNGPKHVSLTE